MTTEAVPTPTASGRSDNRSLAQQGLRPSGCIHWNLVAPELIQQAVRRDEGMLADMGPFVAVTSPHTGRSPNDKFVANDPDVAKDVWWGKVNQPIPPEKFDALLADVQKYLDASSDLFVQDLWAGADPAHRLSVRFVSPNAWHMAFVRNMFLRPTSSDLPSFVANFTVLHAPEMQADPANHGTRTGTFIVLSFAKRMILIGGTRYAGELKKSIFTVMNYLMPKENVLSMHCSANVGEQGDTALFFGLSGTGKTTLSADPHRFLVGDDEHGWSDDGVFNFEGGCYAKAINLSADGEPEIYRTTQMFGTVLENTVLNPIDAPGRLRRPVDHGEHARQLPDALHQTPRCGRSSGASEERRVPHRRCVRRTAADRRALTRAGDVLLPLGLHREGRGHGARREGAAGDV